MKVFRGSRAGVKRSTAIAAAVILPAMATGALSQEPITSPERLNGVTQEQVLDAWPSGARGRGVEGAARLRCVISVQGLLEACAVLSETPAGEGFGQAAVGLTPLYRYRPARIGAGPVPSETTLDYGFRLSP